MTTYTATFRTDAEYATYEFKADTPQQALALAHQLYDDDPLELMFQSYDGGMPVNEIEIIGPSEGNPLALWRDEELWLQLAARDLFTALQAVFTWWTETRPSRDGEDDMATELFDAMCAAIAKAKGGAA
jgi:hypothetical protein